jgi:hypothetical protein
LDIAIFAGGAEGENTSNSVTIYNWTSNTWSTTSMPDAWWGLSATSTEDIAIFAGGQGSGFILDVSNLVTIYNATTGMWSTKPALTVPRCYIGMASLNGLAFFAGGLDNISITNIVDIWDVKTDQWYTASLSEARMMIAATSVRDVVIFAGGSAGDDTTFTAVDIYNITSGQWSNSSLPEGNYGLVGTTLDDLAIFAGGGVANKHAYVYNVTSGQWDTLQLTREQGSAAGVSICNSAMYGGGMNSDYSLIDDVNILQLNCSEVPCVSCVFDRSPKTGTLWNNTRSYSIGNIGVREYNTTCCIYSLTPIQPIL